MSIAYATCRITFKPKDKQLSDRKYSARSMIELRLDNDEYTLRALDIENSRKEIFKFIVTSEDLYQFGESNDKYDIVQANDGFYCFQLEETSRKEFHAALRSVFSILDSSKDGVTKTEPRTTQATSTFTVPEDMNDEKNILIDIHELGDSIRNGDQEKAEKCVENLTPKLYHLNPDVKIGILDKKKHEQKIQIRVKLDSINVTNGNSREPYQMSVYETTTINELRVVFAAAYGYSIADQYFFVNGHLAYGTSTMQELNAQNDPLFVLLLTT